MRVGILTSWPLGSTVGSGVTESVRGFATGLRDRGQEVSVVAPVKRALPGPTLMAARRVFYNGGLPRRIRNAQRRDQLDVLLGFDYDGCYLEPRRRPPLTAFCGGTLADILRYEKGWNRLLLRLQARLEAQNLSQAEQAAVPSRYAADSVLRHYGLSPGKVHVVPLAVDSALWDGLDPIPPDPPPEPPVVLSVARHYPRKGLDLLLEAWAGLHRHTGGTLALVGSGPRTGALRRLAEERGLLDSVRFVGEVEERARLKGWYARAHLFCLPSRHETFGLVFLEAALHGLPVVALDTTAVGEVVAHGRTGYLVDPTPEEGLPERLQGVLRDLLEQDQERLETGRAARKAALGRNWSDAAGDLLPLLNPSRSRS